MERTLRCPGVISMSSVARKYRGRPPKWKDEELFEDTQLPQSPSMNAYQFIEMKETTAECPESLEHPESTESQSVQLYDFGGATLSPTENDENAFDLGNNNEESQLPPMKKERRGRKKIDKSQMAISKVIRVSRKRTGRPPGSRKRGRWPAKAAVEIPAVVETSSADISLQNLLFNADSLIQMGGEVLFASKLGAEWNVHPSRLLAKLDRFSLTNLGMKFEELLRFVDKMPLIERENNISSPTFDDFLNENAANKRKILSQWLLELYCAQCQKESDQIPWNNVTITGWPPGVYKNLNYVSVLDLNLIFEAYKRSEIIFTVNN